VKAVNHWMFTCYAAPTTKPLNNVLITLPTYFNYAFFNFMYLVFALMEWCYTNIQFLVYHKSNVTITLVHHATITLVKATLIGQWSCDMLLTVCWFESFGWLEQDTLSYRYAFKNLLTKIVLFC